MNEQPEHRQSALILPFEQPSLKLRGKEPPSKGNWLANMVQGTRFFARRKNFSGSEVDDFVVYTDPKTMPVVLLARNTYGRDGEVAWHDPQVFSNTYTYYMTLEILEPKENKNGNSNKIPPGSVAGDAKPEVISKLDEEE